VSGIVAGDGVAVSDGSLRLDLPVMLAATIVLLPIFWSGFEIRRWEGVVLVSAYVGYIAYLVLDAGDHDTAEVIGPAALLSAPLVALGLAVAGYQGWRRHRTHSIRSDGG
jgi:cation:H+ antiporter